MKSRELCAGLMLTGAVLTGCSSEADSYRGETEITSVNVPRAIGNAATTGVLVVPYKITFPDGSVAERSFASIDGEVSCSPVGAQWDADIEKLYAISDDGTTLVQFDPPASDDQIHTKVTGINKNTVQCVSFDLAYGDKFIVNGVPMLGVFENGTYSFVINPTE